MKILGIDIGGSGIKGALVDTDGGELLTDRYRLPTPESAKPDPMAATVAKIVQHFDWQGPVGCGFPAVVKEGVVYTAANVSKHWIGVDANRLMQKATQCPTLVMNDADAAGLAEVLHTALTLDDTHKARLIEAGHHEVEEHYSEAAIVSAYGALYAGLTPERGQHGLILNLRENGMNTP